MIQIATSSSKSGGSASASSTSAISPTATTSYQAPTSASSPVSTPVSSTLPATSMSAVTTSGAAMSASGVTTTGASSTASSTTSTSGPSSGGGGFLVPSKEEFINAVTQNGFPTPSDAQYESFAKGVDSKTFSSKKEVAMFLAQLIHESIGLTAKSELRCAGNGCPGEYSSAGDPPDKHYYGRGYIQLSWSYNYKAASEGIFGDANKLFQDPDLVAKDEDTSWSTSFWFWRTKVHPDPGVQSGQFGSSTKVINGGLECGANAGTSAAPKRFQYYSKVLQAFGINEKPKSAGC